MTVADLTPIALAQLEAKLETELAMVRKVRALLEEHRISVAGAGTVPAPMPGTVAAASAPSPAPQIPSLPDAPGAARVAARLGHQEQPPVPRRSFEEIFLDCVKAMPPEGFNLGPLKMALYKAGTNVSDAGVKSAMNRLIRQGRVVVVQTAIGRIGNIYRYVTTAEELAEKAAAEAATASAGAEKDASVVPEGGP